MATVHFKGKSIIWNHHLSVPYHTLEPQHDHGIRGKDESENLILEGDNLLALKSLLPKYQGLVKCIYIDPPYNTGNEGWTYNDSVNSPLMKEWIGKVVGAEGEDLTRHDKWLCMMTPRLKLLQELLADNGVIFVSVDENEAYNLRLLMDEIFQEKNYVGNLVWQSRTSISNDKEISLNHNHTLVYSKKRESLSFQGLRLDPTEYSNPDGDARGDWKPVPLDANKPGGDTKYGIKNPTTRKLHYPPNNRSWSLNEADFKALLKDGRIWFGKDGTSAPKKKLFLLERLNKNDTITPSSLLLDAGTTKDGTKEIVEIFGDEFFDYPKPSSMIKRLIDFGTDKDSIVLDSFAGSGTTAHAVMDLNKTDRGSRRFILVQLPEKIDHEKPAYKAGYRWVHEITRDRVRKVIKTNGYKTGFTYASLGPAIDAESLLAGKLPTYEAFAKYVFYLATGKHLAHPKGINEKDYFVGSSEQCGVFLIYQRNLETLKGMAITLDWAQKMHAKRPQQKIVYAPACYLDDDTLNQLSIQFVNIPYNLFERKS